MSSPLSSPPVSTPETKLQSQKRSTAASIIQRNFRQYSDRMKQQAPSISEATRKHVHVGDNRTAESQGPGLWDGGGLHMYGGLQRRVVSEGVVINREHTDTSGVIQASITKPNYGPPTKPSKWPGGSKGKKASEPYTLYPKGVRPLQADVAAETAFSSAKTRRPGTEFLSPSATQPEGRFTGYAAVKDGSKKQRLLRIQGHFTDLNTVTSHYPMGTRPADKHAQQRYDKWMGKNNWQKLQQLGYINESQAEQMRNKVVDKRRINHAKRVKDILKGK